MSAGTPSDNETQEIDQTQAINQAQGVDESHGSEPRATEEPHLITDAPPIETAASEHGTPVQDTAVQYPVYGADVPAAGYGDSYTPPAQYSPPPSYSPSPAYSGPAAYSAPPMPQQQPYADAPYGAYAPYAGPESTYAQPSDYRGASEYPAPLTEEPKAKPARTGRVVLIAAVTAAIVGGGVGAATVAVLDDNSSNSASAGLSVSTATGQNTAKIDGSVTAAAAKIQPSVVTINVTGSQESGTGSGVILRSDGYILTNDHVVSVADNGGSISVVTTDGQTGSATVVGVDAADDLAVVKVTGLKNLTAATFAKSSAVKVGQSVVAVGAPLGLSDTVTSGIVSNTARPVRSGDNDQAVFEAIQTDAAINPGNSGGPLVDLNGNVIGINAAIATANSGGLSIPGQSTESGSIGIGFAIPADEASRIASELITSGKATHAVIGVTVQGAASGSSAQGSSTPTVIGATIQDVTAKGPAAAAGLKSGDVVTGVDSQRIDDADSLIAAIRSHAPGDTVELTYTRGGGAAQTAKVTLGTATT
ncbi:putative serine protease PepD [Jatrophihabitans sp. GAS493]|nr:putative serine protease PepD [Jatrophihabitans sp. GAS493]